MTQLPFRLSLPPRFGRDDFMVSPANAAALDTIERWPDWPDPVLLLVGPAGSGKTHLAHLWAARSGAAMVAAGDVDALLEVADLRAGVIDGADGSAIPEPAFFHLLNRMREGASSLLITARQPPDRWRIATPDLLSRLRLAPMVRIEPPDEGLMRAVLVKLFDDRQIRVEAPLIDYLVVRLERSLAAVRAAVEALDEAGLSSGRRITRHTAAAVLPDLQLDAD